MTGIFGFFSGYFLNRHFDRQKALRDKAKQLDTVFYSELRPEILESIKSLEDGTYIKVKGEGIDTISITDKKIRELIVSSNVFSENKGRIQLIYAQDKVFTKSANQILEFLDQYSNVLNDYIQNIKDIDTTIIPPSFESDLIKTFKVERESSRMKEFSMNLIYCAILGSQYAFTGGRTWVVDMVKDNFSILQSFVFQYDSLKIKSEELADKRTELMGILSKMEKEISDLHNRFLNERLV
jgi:hypothetical protein